MAADLESILSQFGPSQRTKPAAAGDAVGAFAQRYGALAQNVGSRIKTDPAILLAQWGLETGWGKSVIPGTNNLGNIKDPSGRGVRATDNMTGSRDAYRAYGSDEEFGEDFAGLLERQYRGAIGAGADAQRYAAAMKAGGYAEDPDYVQKLVQLTNRVRRATGAAPSSPPTYSRSQADVVYDHEVANREARRRQAALDEGGSVRDLGRSAQAAGGQMIAGIGWGLESDAIERLGEAIAQNAEENMSERMKLARSKNFIDEDDEGNLSFGDAFADPWAIASVVVEGMTSLVPMVGASGLAAKVAIKQATAEAVKQATARAVAQKLSGEAAQKYILQESSKAAAAAAGRAGLIAGGATEGVLEGTAAGREVGHKVRAMAFEALQANSEAYRSLVEGGATPEQAREEIARVAESQAALTVGGGATLTGAVAGNIIGKALAGKTPKWMGETRLARTGTAATGQFAQEGFQGGSGQALQNLAVQQHADETQRTGEGVADASVREGIGGAGIGGAFGMLSPAQQEVPEQPPNAPLTKAANAAQAAAAAVAQAGTGATPGAAGVTAEGEAVAEFDQRFARVASFVEDKSFLRALRGAEGYGPESVTELLSAYVKARNPNVDDLVRERALAALEQFIDSFARRPDFTFGRAGPGTAAPPGTAVAAPAGTGVGPAVTPAARDDGRTLEGEARVPAERLSGPPVKTLPPVLPGLPSRTDGKDVTVKTRVTNDQIKQAVTDGYRFDGNRLVKAGAAPIALSGPHLAVAREAVRRRDAPPRLPAPPVSTAPAVAPAASDPIADAGGLTVKFAGQTYPVGSLDEAAAKWTAFRDQSNAGVSEIGNGIEIRDRAGALVARISYNGRIWNPDGSARASAQPAKAAATVSEMEKVAPAAGAAVSLAARMAPHLEALRAMAADAGWAEEGGRLLRDAQGNVTGRTPWIARAAWFVAGMEGRPDALAAAIETAAAGERVPAKQRRTIEGMIAWLEAQRERRPIDADSSYYDMAEAGYEDVSATVQAVPDLFEEVSETEAMAVLGFTPEEINEALAAGAGTEAQVRGADTGRTEAGQGDRQGLDLASYSPAELRAQEQRRVAAEAAEAERQRALAQRAQADAERGGFALTGSERPADVRAAQGQGGLFEAPPPAPPAEIKSTLDAAAHEAATSPLNDKPPPTDRQREAGNFPLGHLRVHGLDISIQNPKGSVRAGVAPSGAAWSVTMPAHYGYIKGTKGADKDHVDIFLGPQPDHGPFWIINQNQPGRPAFDEHKVMLGYASEFDAVADYLLSFSDNFGGQVYGSVAGPFSVEKFKALIPELAKAKAIPTPKGTTGAELGVDPAARLERLRSRVARFASGLSRQSDLQHGAHALGGYQSAGVGVDVGELSAQGIDTLAHAVINWRTQVFIDSGAFSAFRRGLKSGDMQVLDFDRVLARYDAILDAIARANPAEESDYPRPLLVMPDVVGDQAASLALVTRYRRHIAAETSGNLARPIVPLQLGDLSLAAAYRQVVEILGTDQFIVGIPSNAKAVPAEAFEAFLREARPRAIHILGAAANKTLTPRLQSIIAAGRDDIAVTADASPIRSAITAAVAAGKTRPEAIRDFLRNDEDPGIARYFAADEEAVPGAAPDDAAAPMPENATAPAPVQPAAAVPEPEGWRKNWGKAATYAEALGLSARGEDGKYLKLPALTAAIEAKRADSAGPDVTVAPGDAFMDAASGALIRVSAVRGDIVEGLGADGVRQSWGLVPHQEAIRAGRYIRQPDEGVHFHAGKAAFGEGKPRELPSYFTTSQGKNPKDWYRGWDAAKADAAKRAAPAVASTQTKPADPDAFAKRIAFLEDRAVKFGRDKIREEASSSLAGSALGREFGESMEALYLRKPELKVRDDATSAWLNGAKAGEAKAEGATEDEGGYTLERAQADLAQVRARLKEQGRMVDGRLMEKARQLENIVAELQAEARAQRKLLYPAGHGFIGDGGVRWQFEAEVREGDKTVSVLTGNDERTNKLPRTYGLGFVEQEMKLGKAWQEEQVREAARAVQAPATETVEPESLEAVSAALEAGQRVHYDYAGTDGRTVWVEETPKGWVVKSRDDDSQATITTGGVGAGGGWSKEKAVSRAREDARYRFTQWKPLAEQAPAVDQILAGKVQTLTERGVEPSQIAQAGAEYQDGDATLLDDLLRITTPEEAAPAAEVDLGALFDEVLAEETAAKPKRAQKAQAQKAEPSEAVKQYAATLRIIAGGPDGTPHVVRDPADKGGQGTTLASFELGANGRPVKVKHYYDHTRDYATLAIEQWAAANKPAAAAKPRTAGAAAKSVAKNTAAGLQEAIAGLGKLFGGHGRLSSGLTFDEHTYAKAKPLFKQAIAHFKEAGTDLKEAMRAVVRMVLDQFGPHVAGNMKPYVVRFMEDVRAGAQSDDSAEVYEYDGIVPGFPSVLYKLGGKWHREVRGRLEPVGSAAGDAKLRDFLDRYPNEWIANGRVDVSQGGGLVHSGKGALIDADAKELGAGELGYDGDAESTQGERDEHRGADNEGDTALGRVPAAEDRGPEGSGDARAAGAQSGRGSDEGNSTAGAKRPRSKGRRGNGAAGVHPAAAGAVSAPNVPAENFRITEDVRLGQGGEVQKFNDNVAAIQILQRLTEERRRATQEEQRQLARYVGWGGLAQAFRNPQTGKFNAGWEKRGEQLEALLTKRELDSTRSTVTDAHYTSQAIVQGMWAIAERLGFQGGLVLEPSVGTGNFIGLVPEARRGAARFIGIEYDGLTARIAKALYPQASILQSGFEKVPMPDNAVDLAIGNPPFGKTSLYFPSAPHLNGKSIHNQFFLGAMDAVRPGGLQMMVVSRYLMDAKEGSARRELAEHAELVGAIRLPDTAFKENARTEVVTDIIILRKLTDADVAAREEARKAGGRVAVPEWVETTQVADPLGGEAITVNRYFAARPEMIVGTLERSGSMRHGNDVTVRAEAGLDIGAALARAAERLPRDVMAPRAGGVERALEQFEAMRESLELTIGGFEEGNILFDDDGRLTQVILAESGSSRDFLKRRPLTAASPWSPQLFMDAQGRWFRQVQKLDDQGNKVKQGNFNAYEREAFARDEDVPETLRLGDKRFARLKVLVGLRDTLKKQIVLETADEASDALEANRAALRAEYEAFVKAHGFVGDDTNQALLATMPDGPLVTAIEMDYDAGVTPARARTTGQQVRKPSATPAPILSRRVVVPYTPPEKAGTAQEALTISLAEQGAVDLKRMAELLKTDVDAVVRDLHDEREAPLIFRDPETDRWEVRDAYLSGQVVRKLAAARDAGLDKNMAALEAVQPEPIPSSDIGVRIGSAWVPPEVYAQFIEHVTGAPATVHFSKKLTTFDVGARADTPSARLTWGTGRMASGQIVAALLNSKTVAVYDTHTDANGNTRRELNEDETTLALAKAEEITNEFADWIMGDADRRQRLTRLYNEQFNNRVIRQYDGSHLTLPGKVPDAVVALRRHQKNAIWRGIAERFMLVDHAVGAGKTYFAIARAMERRRTGLSQKPMIVVPNHMVEQFAADVYRLYPGARVLAMGQKDLEAQKRRRAFARIATGDWDIVIVPHSSFGFMGISPEREEMYLQAEIKEMEEAIRQAAAEDSGEGWRKPQSVKTGEAILKGLNNRLQSIRDTKRDNLLTFEQLGVDDMTIDEAHEFKNLMYHTRLTKVLGLGSQQGSKKAYDLYNKVRVLRDSPRGSVVFMTGTPISNSVVEMYTIMKYLAMDELVDYGIDNFDAWHKQFAEAVTKFEMNDVGRLTEKTRLSRWSNMPELMKLYYGFTDAVSLDDIKRWHKEDKGHDFPVPKVKGGARRNIIVQPTEAQLAILQNVIAGFDGLKHIEDVKARNAERLRLMNRARNVALDARVADRGNPSDEKGGKLDMVAGEVARIYRDWDADKGAQLVFLDRSVPKSNGDKAVLAAYDKLQARMEAAVAAGDQGRIMAVSDDLAKYDAAEIEQLRAAQNGGWNAYRQIKDNLIERGIPAEQIRFIQEANTDEQKQQLFDMVKSGEVRVLIGSTPKMGAGTNVQDRLVALHHVDVNWKPSDIEQREGRIVRQGNELREKYRDEFEVEVIAYATERTYDAKMWALNEAKGRFINSLRAYTGEREIEVEDQESENMAEMAALASGDPRMLERVQLDAEVKKLEMLRRSHNRRQGALEDAITDARKVIESVPTKIEAAKLDDRAIRSTFEAAAQEHASRSVEIEGEVFTSFAEAETAAERFLAEMKGDNERARFSLMIDGKPYTSKDAVSKAIRDALGDVEPLPLELADGERFRRISAAGSRIAQLLNSAIVDGDETVDLGTLKGLPLKAYIGPEQVPEGGGDGQVALDIDKPVRDITLSVEGRHMRDARDLTTDKATGTAGPTAIASVLSSLNRGLGSGSSARYLEQRLTSAKADLPALEAQAGKPFLRQGEYETKRARLEELTSILSTDTAAQSETPAESTSEQSVLRQAPGQGVDFEPISVDDAAGVVARVRPTAEKVWNVDLRLVPTHAALPQAVRDQVARDYGADERPKGVLSDEVVYLVADAHASPADLETTIVHEVKGHVAARRFYGADITQALNRLFVQIGGLRGLQRVAEARGLTGALAGYARALGDSAHADEVRVRVMMEEVLAHLAQAPRFMDRVKAIIGMVRAWLRKSGLVHLAEFGETDLLHVLRQAERTLATRPDAGSAPTVLARRSNGAVNNEIKDALQQWQSKAVADAAPELERARAKRELQAALKDAAMSDEDKHKLAYNWSARAQHYAPPSGGLSTDTSASPVAQKLAMNTPEGVARRLATAILAAAEQGEGVVRAGGYVYRADATAPFKWVNIDTDTGGYIGAINYEGGPEAVVAGLLELLLEDADLLAETRIDLRKLEAEAPAPKRAIRPRLNSEGRPIHPTDEGIRNFWRWFGDSKGVDAEGQPQIVYHGTRAELEGGHFRPGTASHSAGIFFSSRPAVASAVYAGGAAEFNRDGIRARLDALSDAQIERAIDAAERKYRHFDFIPTEDLRADLIDYLENRYLYHDVTDPVLQGVARELAVRASAPATGANVVPVYLALQNPLEIDGTGQAFDPEQQAEWLRQAREGGHDGLIIRRYEDGGLGGFAGEYRSAGRHDVFVAFRPEQIKSATGNVGTFDPANPSIMASRKARLESLGLGGQSPERLTVADFLDRSSAPRASRSARPSESGASMVAPQGAQDNATGLTADAFRAALVERFGEAGVASLEAQGLLNIGTGVQGVAAWYDPDTGRAWFDPARMASHEEAIGAVLHEVGEHHGLAKMLGPKAWRVLKGRVAALARDGKNDIAAAWAGVIDTYPEFAGQQGYDTDYAAAIGDDRFMHEVIAKLGEAAAGHKSSLWRDVLAAVNRFLLKMGLGRQINKHELADLVAGSLKRVMAGKEPHGRLPAVGHEVMAGRSADALAAARRVIRGVIEKWRAGDYSGRAQNFLPVGERVTRTAASVGIDLRGYSHSIDQSALRHVERQHGNAQKEAMRGQLAIEDADFDNVPLIVSEPDYLVFGAKNHLDKDVVGYIKRMPDGHTLYIEEIRTGRSQLALDSMRKYPGGRNAISVAETLGPNVRNDSGALFTVLEVATGRKTQLTADEIRRGSKYGPMAQRPFNLADYTAPRGEQAKSVVQSLFDAARAPAAGKFNWLHKTIATQLHKASTDADFRRIFQMATEYENDLARMAARPTNLAPDLLPSFDQVGKAFNRVVHGNRNAKALRKVADALFAGTLAGSDVTTGRVWSEPELRTRFGLDDTGIELYRQARNAINASLQEAAAGLAWQIVKRYVPELKDGVRSEPELAREAIETALRTLEDALRETAAIQRLAEEEGAIAAGTTAKTLAEAGTIGAVRRNARAIFERADALALGGYAPLMRFGKFAVDVVETLEDGTEERSGFYKFENELEAKLAADKLGRAHPHARITRSVMSEEAWKIYRGVDPDVVALFAESLEGVDGLEVKQDVLQEWYRKAVNDRSAFKRMIQRKGVEGFDRDLTRVVANFVTSNARLAARQFNMGDMAAALADMQERKVAGDVQDEAIRLKEYMENADEPFKQLKGWMFAWFLGGSVSSALLNLTQPLMMTYPYLAQFGPGRAAVELTRAGKAAASGKVADAELAQALQRASEDGKVDPQQIHHLYHEGMKSFISKLPLGEGARARAQGVMSLWGFMFGWAENFNRRITFIAAYRMAKADPKLGDAYAFAVRAVDETQGIYAKSNRPNWARGTGPFGAVGVAAFTFKQYSISYVELLIRLAKAGPNGRVGAAIMLGTLVMLSGLQGAPGAEDLEDIIDTVAQYLGYTGNSRLALHEWLREQVGTEAANVVMHGALTALPFDFSARVGLGNLMPATALLKPSEPNKAAQVADIVGPPASMAAQIGDALAAFDAGAGPLGIAAAFSPVAMRNALKGFDMVRSGEYRDVRGRKVVDTDLVDAAFKAMGMQPQVVSETTRPQRMVQMTAARVRQVKSAIHALKAQAVVEDDNGLRAKADRMLADWNRKNPDARIRVDGAAVLRRVKEMRAERATRLMKALPREYRETAREVLQ